MGNRHEAQLEVGARSAPENFVIFGRFETKFTSLRFWLRLPPAGDPPLFRADLARSGAAVLADDFQVGCFLDPGSES